MGSRLLVKRQAPKKSKSQLIEIVELDEEPSQYATVKYVGSYKLRDGREISMDVKPGDTILLKKYSGTPVTINGEELFFVEDDDALAIVS
jgi:chaperonin GroES